MVIRSNPSQKFVFGPFEYDSVSGDLRKHGSRIRLQGQPQRILTLLVQRHEQVVRREELQQHLWHGTTFVDFEQGLNAAVNKLRQALGDSADQPRYIETIPGKGYRFICPLRPTQARAVLEFAAPPDVRPSRTAAVPPKLWLGAAFIVVVAAGAYWLGTRRSELAPPPAAARFAVTPPAGYALEGGASRQSFALSPDGTKLAFTAMDVSGAFSVFVRDFGSLDAVQLANSRGAHTLFWPPDGQSLFFTVRGKLRRSPLAGDGDLEVCDAPSFCFSGAWVSAERLLIGGLKTYQVSPSGGRTEALEASRTWPQALPDAKHILYSAWDSGIGKHRAYVARLDDTGSARPLLDADSRVMYTASQVTPGVGYLLYIRAGALIAAPFNLDDLRVTGEPIPIVDKVYSFSPTGAADFSVSDKGVIAYQTYVERSQLAWVDRSGRVLSRVGPANVNVKSARLSPDGKMLATAIYDVARGAQTLWLFDTESGAGRQMTLDAGVRDAPVWSPDSKRLAFLLAYGSPPRIAFRSVDSSDTEEVLASDSYRAPAAWSPDGRFVTYMDIGFVRSESEAHGDVWMADLERGGEPVPLLRSAFHEANPVFSPDGRWIAFTSTESGQSELYMQAFQGGETPGVTGPRYAVSQSGALAVRWGRNSSELYYLAFDGTVRAVSVKFSPKPTFGKAESLFSISTEARAAIHSIIGFDVSADGQRFVIPVVEPTEGPSIVVIQNWESLLQTKPAS